MVIDWQQYEKFCSGFRIRPIDTLRGFRRCVELQRQIWKYPSLAETVPSSLLALTPHNGGILLGAFDPFGRMVGFVYSLLGCHHGNMVQHSHMLGILPAYRCRHIGWVLKLAQRDLSLAMGIKTIVWTFDPLQSGNARFNFWRLGVVADSYVPNMYGRSSSALHGSLPTDRFLVRWDLIAPRVHRKIRDASQGTPAADTMPDKWRSLAHTLPQAAGPGFHLLPVGRGLLIEIPTDVESLKREKNNRVVRWQKRLREACRRYFTLGFKVNRFYQEILGKELRSFYYLSPPAKKSAVSFPPADKRFILPPRKRRIHPHAGSTSPPDSLS